MVEKSITDRTPRGRLAAVVGVLGAIFASSCCVVPLVLVTMGVSGAWIGTLSALAPYQGYVAAFTLGVLGLGFWRVYGAKVEICADGSYCGSPAANRLTKIALWCALALVGSALSIDWWAPLFY